MASFSAQTASLRFTESATNRLIYELLPVGEYKNILSAGEVNPANSVQIVHQKRAFEIACVAWRLKQFLSNASASSLGRAVVYQLSLSQAPRGLNAR